MSLFNELKRRNVFRVGIAYAFGAWVVLQVVDLVLDNSDVPAWVMDVFFLVAVLGFVVALVMAWAFEITPEGIRREQDVARDDESSDTGSTQSIKKLDFITLGAVVLLVILLAADRFTPRAPDADLSVAAQSPSADTDAQNTGAANSSGVIPDDGAGLDNAFTTPANIAPGAPAEVALGVAVLPFDNLSAEEGNAFFAGGMHEDVLTHLSRIGGLRVISRTSMIRVAERGLDIRQIGAQLGVTHVLEGSVRRAGEQVRVTVQLIDAATDEHLWAENFDRTLDDIFVIQSEIARAIAGQLEAELSPEAAERIDAVPTRNLAAYELYVQARELNRSWRGSTGFDEQRVLLEQAVAMDPEFLEAQALLANAYGRLVWTSADPEGIYREKALLLTETIERNWPENTESQMARARYTYNIERDYEQALKGFMALLPERPNDILLLLSISSSHKRLAESERALPFILKAAELDPENPSVAGEEGVNLMGAGRGDEAIAHMRESVERFPDDVSLLSNFGRFLLAHKGDLSAFLALHERIAALPDVPEDFLVPGRPQYQRIRLLGQDLNGAGPNSEALEEHLARLETYARKRDSWAAITILIDHSQLLKLAGQENRSRERAREVLAAVDAELGSGRPLPGNMIKAYYARIAYLACLADDPSAYNRYRAVTNALKASELGVEFFSNLSLGLAAAECGDMDSAWSLMSRNKNNLFRVTPWELALDPLYVHYFSGFPAYEEEIKDKVF